MKPSISGSLFEISKMILVTVFVWTLTTHWLTPVQGFTTSELTFTTTSDKISITDPGDKPPDTGGRNGRRLVYVWPFVFAVGFSAIFGGIYHCVKNNKCQRCRRGRGSDQEAPDGTASEMNGSDDMPYVNRAYDGDFPVYPGMSTELRFIEMKPPPYIDKPPDYEEIQSEIETRSPPTET